MSPSNAARCPACDSVRRAAFRYCLVCGFDFEPRPPVDHQFVLPESSQPERVAPDEAATVALDGAEAEGPRSAGRLTVAAVVAWLRTHLDALDSTTRRQLARVAVELGVLAAVILVGAVLLVPRSDSVPPSYISGPTLGLTADDAIRTFSLPRLGSYTFTTDRTAAAGRIVGEPEDGWSTLELLGDPRDLSAIALTVQTYGTVELDPRQRRHVTAFLTIYAPDEVEPMLAAIHDALATPEDTSVGVGTAEVQVRLETVHVSAGTLTVRLVLAPPPQTAPP